MTWSEDDDEVDTLRDRDAPDAVLIPCDECRGPAHKVCCCSRCIREPDPTERFHACDEHLGEVEDRHYRVRGKACEWVEIP